MNKIPRIYLMKSDDGHFIEWKTCRASSGTHFSFICCCCCVGFLISDGQESFLVCLQLFLSVAFMLLFPCIVHSLFLKALSQENASSPQIVINLFFHFLEALFFKPFPQVLFIHPFYYFCCSSLATQK